VPGHEIAEIMAWLTDKQYHPRCIVARTVKGKGICFMEGNPAWHHQVPKGDEIAEARKALA
jgi:transketolase